MPHVFLDIEQRRIGNRLAGTARGIGQLGLHQQAQLVGGIEVFRKRTMRMMARLVESGPTHQRDATAELRAVGFVDVRDRISPVISAPADEQGASVEEELTVLHRQLAGAEPFVPCANRTTVASDRDTGRVQVRAFRRPEPSARQRQSQDDVLPRRGFPDSGIPAEIRRHAQTSVPGHTAERDMNFGLLPRHAAAAPDVIQPDVVR